MRAPFSPIHPFSHLVTCGGMGGSASTARNSLTLPRARRDALLIPGEHIPIGRGLRARKLAARPAHLHRTEIIFSILTSFTFQAGSEERPSTARVERGPSEAARSASKEGPPHCQPVTSYPFSCRHRLTKFV